MPPLYVPILKGKEGEYGALAELSEDVKVVTMPLLEIPDVPRDWEKERPSKTIEDHVSNVAERIHKAWGNAPVFLDFSWLTQQNFDNGVAATGWVLNYCHERELNIVPVLGRTNSTDHVECVRRHHALCGLGACLRLAPADFS